MTKWSKRIIRWTRDDILYLSVVFTWDIPLARALAARHNGPVVAGGPAIALVGCEGWADYAQAPPDGTDILSKHNPEATFTTRGCIRRCEFCAVPRTEGRLRELRDWPARRLVCDNNFLAASHAHIRHAVQRLKRIEHVDFNQGLDARLFTDWHAEQLSLLHKPKIRFALDDTKTEPVVARAVERARAHGLRDIGIYVLIGFNDTPEDAQHRLETVRSWKIRPNPMRYQPLDAWHKNKYIAPEWTSIQLQDMMRYYSRLLWLEHVTFEEYQEHELARRWFIRMRRGERKGST